MLQRIWSWRISMLWHIRIRSHYAPAELVEGLDGVVWTQIEMEKDRTVGWLMCGTMILNSLAQTLSKWAIWWAKLNRTMRNKSVRKTTTLVSSKWWKRIRCRPIIKRMFTQVVNWSSCKASLISSRRPWDKEKRLRFDLNASLPTLLLSKYQEHQSTISS